MPYSLAQLALRAGVRRKRVVVTKIEPTRAQAAEYAATLLAVPDAWARAIALRVLPAYDRALATRRVALGITRDSADELGQELDLAENRVDALVATVTPKMRSYGVVIEQWHRAAWVAKVRAAVGVNVSPIVGATGAQETLDAFYQRNLGLIQSISDETKRRIGNTIWAGYENLTSRDEMAAEIEDQVNMSRDRARRIAVDQTTKLSAALDQQRQREAGISVYRWHHSRKAHPRIEHIARDGRLFSWDKPPPDGPPGTLPFCGCKAEATLELDVASDDQSGVVAA